MAVGEIFLSAFIQVVFEKLASPEFIKFARRQGVHTAIKKWTEMLKAIREVLDDAEEKQVAEVRIKGWLEELQDLAYDVDDMLDEFSTEALRKLVLEPESSKSKVRSLIPTCCTSFSPSAFAFKLRIRSKIEEINSRLEDICERRTKLGLERVAPPKGWQKPTSTSLVDESCVYGREEDKEKIIKLLLKDEANNDKFCVIPIVGMGGVGKTTLAQLVYNNQTMLKRFDLKAWVCVSDDFDVKRIMKTILGSISPTTSVSEDDLNRVQIKLKEALTGKKFLVVLDDVWNNKPTDWDALWTPFRAGAQESKVIVTTRDRDVASLLGTDQNQCHGLSQLSDDECWSVFVHYAFENRNIGEHQNLESIGRQIVNKCKGLPLAARTLGGILCCKLEENEWKNILNNRIWDLPERESDILPALRLSYDHLPPHLKRCFAYCSILPKDYKFGEKEIVLLWMAEGFLQQHGEKQMEDFGHEYFHDLLSTSFFQESSSNKSLFVMHDLINDLAQWAAGNKCFRLENNLGEISKRARHSSYVGGEYDGIKKFKVLDKVKCLRTFLPLMIPNYGDYYLTNHVPFVLLPKFRCLRVLSLNGYHITELPNSIGDLKHLRYLDLSRTEIRSLPESISTLYNLQTLILRDCHCLMKFPAKLRNLFNLRHLDITGVHSLTEMPLGIGELLSLRTLPNFVVDEGSGSRIKELRNLMHLREILISKLGNVRNALDAREANLNDKHELDLLKMGWRHEFDCTRNESVEKEVLDMLQPHKNLKELTIEWYGGTKFPTWIGDPSFSHTVLLKLEFCVKCTSLPPLGQLPVLKDLCIEGMNEVTNVGLEFNGESCLEPFPSLVTLSFRDMGKWENWLPCEVFPRLHKLSIEECPKLLGKLPDRLPLLEELIMHGCEQLAVSISSLPKLCKFDIKGWRRRKMERIDTLISQKPTVFELISDNAELKCLTEGSREGLTKVESLEILHCDELTTLWMKEGGLLQNLTSLRCLKISGCDEFVSLVAEQQQQQLGVPCRLESLHLDGCNKLKKLHGLHILRALRVLTIAGCPRLVSFPETGLPFMLRELRIAGCDSLTSLSSRGELPASLELLDVANCPKLESVAKRFHNNMSLESIQIRYCESLKSLPEGLHNSPISLLF